MYTVNKSILYKIQGETTEMCGNLMRAEYQREVVGSLPAFDTVSYWVSLWSVSRYVPGNGRAFASSKSLTAYVVGNDLQVMLAAEKAKNDAGEYLVH